MQSSIKIVRFWKFYTSERSLVRRTISFFWFWINTTSQIIHSSQHLFAIVDRNASARPRVTTKDVPTTITDGWSCFCLFFMRNGSHFDCRLSVVHEIIVSIDDRILVLCKINYNCSGVFCLIWDNQLFLSTSAFNIFRSFDVSVEK